MTSQGILRLAVVALLATACSDTSAPNLPDIHSPRSTTNATESLITFYGPERFIRGRGAPQPASRTISTKGYRAPFVLRIRNGDAAGSSRVSSATVSLDGVPLLTPADFDQSAAAWSIPVEPGAVTTLDVVLASAPGSHLEISLEGAPAHARFCPTDPTAFGNLRAAIEATEAGGTIVVCDGDFTVDMVLIDRPLTLRAEHSGQATLRDVNASQPALVVDGIASGLVRIADLRFAISGTAIVTGTLAPNAVGTWDRVEVDSVQFLGTVTSARVIRPQPSTVATARMDVTNSAFDNIGIGVFPAGGEVNVRNSVFSRIGSGVTYTFSIPALAPTGTTEGNVFHGCGGSGCIRVLGGGGITIRDNRIESGELGVAANQFLNSGVITVQLNAAVARPQVVVEGNTIIGRRRSAEPPEQSGGYADAVGIVVSAQQPNQVLVRDNQISNVWIGLSLGGGSTSTIEARDNVLTGGAYAINRVNTVTQVTVTRNDFTGFVRSIRGTNAATGHYRCNWWGGTAGPQVPEAQVPGTMYAPWSLEPVAGSGAACDPTPLQSVLVCQTMSPDVFTVPSAAQALSVVSAGGTVLFCDGTHVVVNLGVNKSVTLAAQGPGVPTIDGQAQFTSLNVTTPDTDVLVRGLRFRNANGHNIHMNKGRSLRVEGSEFHPFESTPYNRDRFAPANGVQSGIGVFAKFTRLEVENNKFLGGDAGVHLSASGPEAHSALVRNNTFRGQTNAGVFVAAAPSGFSLNVEGNDFSECGRHGCSRAFTGGSDGLANLMYVGNIFSVDISRPVWSVMVMNLAPAASVTARSNRIVGTGIGAGTRFETGNYPIDGQAFQYSGHLVLDRNTIENAFAVATNTAAALLLASNNTVNRVAEMLNSAGGPGSAGVIWRRNDATDVMRILPFAGSFGSYFLDCNWWGASTGPSASQVGSLPASSWTPFATQPIANLPSVSCTP